MKRQSKQCNLRSSLFLFLKYIIPILCSSFLLFTITSRPAAHRPNGNPLSLLVEQAQNSFSHLRSISRKVFQNNWPNEEVTKKTTEKKSNTIVRGREREKKESKNNTKEEKKVKVHNSNWDSSRENLASKNCFHSENFPSNSWFNFFFLEKMRKKPRRMKRMEGTTK